MNNPPDLYGGRDVANEQRVDRELAELRAEVALLRSYVQQLAGHACVYLPPPPQPKADPGVMVVKLQEPTR